MSPARDERRQAVLGLLAQHGDIEWHGYGQDVAFADEVLELAARLGRVEAVPAMRPSRIATDKERRAAMTQIRAVFGRGTSGTGSPESEAKGQVGTRTPLERPGASEGVA